MARVSPDRGTRLLAVFGLLAGCLLAVGVAGDVETVTGAGGPPTAGSAPVRRPRSAADGRRVRPTGHRAGRDAPPAPPAHPGIPRTVVIPALRVRAPVVPVVTQGRVLVPPSDPTSVGWWRSGARPGARHGAAVLTGHTVSTGGGVFDDLERLRPGDVVLVATTRTTLRFEVDRATVYAKRSLAESAQRLFGQAGRGRLVLVTCDGWNGRVYRSNVVATARLGASRR